MYSIRNTHLADFQNISIKNADFKDASSFILLNIVNSSNVQVRFTNSSFGLKALMMNPITNIDSIQV